MAKRFHDTEIWEQDWFIDLPNKYKLVWNFIKDKCDDCGVWRPNSSLIQKILGEPVSLEDFLTFVNTDEKQRILVLPNKRWFLREYFIFQYGNKFNPQSPVHRGFLKRLLTHSIHLNQIPKIQCYKLHNVDLEELSQIAYQYPNNSLLIGYGYPINRAKDKDKDNNKDKDKDKDKDNIEDTKEPEKKINGHIQIKADPIGSENIKEFARLAWGDQIWKENTCMAQGIKEQELKKWMAMYNSSIMNDTIPNFNANSYKKMFGGWLQGQKAKGYSVNSGIKEVDVLKKI